MIPLMPGSVAPRLGPDTSVLQERPGAVGLPSMEDTLGPLMEMLPMLMLLQMLSSSGLGGGPGGFGAFQPFSQPPSPPRGVIGSGPFARIGPGL